MRTGYGVERVMKACFASALLALLSQPAALAQGAHQPAASEKLGEVEFPVSCTPAAQQRFNRAVSILHSFWYEEALKAFTTVTEADPACAMGHWGIAMSLWYPLWYPPSEAALKQGWGAIERAKAIGAKTERERDYIAAIEAFYRDSDKLDHRARSALYETAMERVYLRYPDDREAAVFYALALDATASPTDKTYANQLKAATILEKVFAEQPNHPGAAHYLIHSYDYASLAERGLPAARRYAVIAPSMPHALHMPSHIFTRLGLWTDSIESNRAASRSARAQGWDQEALHTMDYLVYAYLQTAQDSKAKQVVDELATFGKAPASLPVAYAIAAIPARFALERRSWSEAAALTAPPIAFPWDRFPWAEAMISFTRAMGAARTGDVATAETEIEKLRLLRDALVQADSTYWADQVEAQRYAAAGILALARGQNERAIQLVRSAAELESSMDKHPATPAAILPARELLGDLLLELGQPAQALSEYEHSLEREPHRFRSLYGAATAARLSGDVAKAKTLYEQLVALCRHADTERPELLEAKALAVRG